MTGGPGSEGLEKGGLDELREPIQEWRQTSRPSLINLRSSARTGLKLENASNGTPYLVSTRAVVLKGLSLGNSGKIEIKNAVDRL